MRLRTKLISRQGALSIWSTQACDTVNSVMALRVVEVKGCKILDDPCLLAQPFNLEVCMDCSASLPEGVRCPRRACCHSPPASVGCCGCRLLSACHLPRRPFQLELRPGAGLGAVCASRPGTPTCGCEGGTMLASGQVRVVVNFQSASCPAGESTGHITQSARRGRPAAQVHHWRPPADGCCPVRENSEGS